jgi:hypothetical protein
MSEALLSVALSCVPRRHLKACFGRILSDIRANRCGLPDLVQFWPQERCYRLIEVKGPGDRLQDNQIRWLTFCVAHEIPVSVCHVAWGMGAAQPASPLSPVSVDAVRPQPASTPSPVLAGERV